MTNEGLLKYAEMEKTAFLPILLGVGKAIGAGLAAYGLYRATTHNLPEAKKHFDKGEYFSSPVTEDDPLGWGVAGDVIEGGLNSFPAGAGAKLGFSGLRNGKTFAQGFNRSNPLKTTWGGASGMNSMTGNTPAPDLHQDSTSTQPVPFDPHYQLAPQPTSTTSLQPGAASNMGRGFQLDGNHSSNVSKGYLQNR